MAYAAASLIFPMGKVRERFIEGRSQKIRDEKLQEYKRLFDYAEKE
jgi:hypothetical protein